MAHVGSLQIAQAFNLTKRRVEQLVHEGMPREDRGKYDLGKCMLWYIRYLQKALESKGGPASTLHTTPEIKSERARLLRADADIREMERSKLEGKLIDAEEVKAESFKLARRARDMLIAIPDRTSPVLAGMTDTKEIHRVLLDEIRVVCGQLASN